MNVLNFSIIYTRTNNANNAIHYVKLGNKRRESSKHNYYIISPRVIIKAIIINTAELVSQTATVTPQNLLPTIIGCDLCAARNTVREPCWLATATFLLPPADVIGPAKSAAAASFAKTRPEVARVWRPSWGGTE